MSDDLPCVQCGAPCREVDRFCSQCGLPDPTSPSSTSPGRNYDSDPTHTSVTYSPIEGPPPDPPNDPPLPRGTVFAHRYRIERLLGEGGMGRVYLATDCSIDEPIALKFVSSVHRTNRTVLDQFKRELKLARKVRHRNVVASFHLGEAEGRSYITQEYIDADSLSVLLRRRGTLPEAEALGLLRQVLRGLRAAHDLGIVHRDIKAGNILVNAGGMAFITDFGLAFSVSQGPDRHVAGTLQYMAPELFEGAAATPASDLYSCGILLFQILTGRFPIGGNDINEFGLAHRLVPPELIPPDLAVSSPTRQIYARMLAKHPLERPQRAVEVLEVFEGVLAADALKVKTERPIALIAGADPTVRSMARELLESEGYHVEAVNTALETLDLVFTLDTAFLVLNSNVEGGREIAFASDASTASLDEILPKHGGLGLCRLMHRDPGLRRVPILVVTEQRHPGLASAFALMGASEVINKPFTREEFEAGIHRARQAALARADDA